MKRRDLFKTAGGALAASVTVAGREFPSGYDASKDLARTGWKPVFLDDYQDQSLTAFADLVVPGSKDALVNRFLDSILAVESRQVQRAFLNALAFLEAESLERQAELASDPAHPAHRHFVVLKDWVARAYYSSEAGQRELGSEGTPPQSALPGCGR